MSGSRNTPPGGPPRRRPRTCLAARGDLCLGTLAHPQRCMTERRRPGHGRTTRCLPLLGPARPLHLLPVEQAHGPIVGGDLRIHDKADLVGTARHKDVVCAWFRPKKALLVHDDSEQEPSIAEAVDALVHEQYMHIWVQGDTVKFHFEFITESQESASRLAGLVNTAARTGAGDAGDSDSGLTVSTLSLKESLSKLMVSTSMRALEELESTFGR